MLRDLRRRLARTSMAFSIGPELVSGTIRSFLMPTRLART